MRKQPIWKLACTVGDINPIEYSGGFVYIDSTGVYGPELEWIESEDQHKAEPTRWTVYRIMLERCSLTPAGNLVPYGFHLRTDLPYPIERYTEWFDNPNWNMTTELREMLCSDNPMDLANAYLELAQYHGWENFDSYPLTFTNRDELQKRYQSKNS